MFDEPDIPNTDVIRLALEEQPSAPMRRGTVWALGNVERVVDDDAYSAALGKISRRKIERYDGDSRAFIQEPSEEAPFTLVLFDVRLQICAIALKSNLGNPTLLANTLARLLTSARTATARSLRITASQIKDPREFVSFLRRAQRITQFEVTFRLPNPIDVDKDFIEPMERLLAETRGEGGKTSISGDHLLPGPLEDISNSAAATGDNAKARLVLPENEKAVTKSLNNNPATFSARDDKAAENYPKLIERMRDLYRLIRRDGDT